MFSIKKALLVVCAVSALASSSASAKSCLLSKKDCDLEIDFWGYFKPESFYGKNFTYLNNNNPQDEIFYFRHTNDFFLNLTYGKETYGHPVAEFKSSTRNRATWGSPVVIQTLPAEAPFLDADMKDHNHALPRLFFWMREAWLKLSLAELLHLDFQNKHFFTLGAFPFELGRGIALGSAYAVGAGPLGFYSDSMIDQFAFGLKLSGDFVQDVLSYDIYGSILQSRSYSVSETNKPVLKNEITRRENPMRGFGKDNFVVAARLNWTAFDSDVWGNLIFEPYVMYNDDPEQKVEFVADATSKLGTFGIATEYVGKRFEFGFDYAHNMGRQYVKPWDRNVIVVENYLGQSVLVNRQVTVVTDNPASQFNGLKAPHVPRSDGQKAINKSADTGDASQNGKIVEASSVASLGYVTDPLQLKNTNRRFRDGYSNTYHGQMVIGDASYSFCDRQVIAAVTAGIATGDVDPNTEVKDGTYDGFIGLQEVYAGKRVKSVFLLGTVGKVRRPGTEPDNPLAPHDFAISSSGFTNLILLGSGVTWKPKMCNETSFSLNPNIFAYWEDVPGRKFDAFTGKHLPDQASRFLGIELNTFLSYIPFKNLKCFAIGSVFFPGAHFKDIKGQPENEAQRRLLARLDRKKLDPDLIPNIGDSIAYTVNIGMEYAF